MNRREFLSMTAMASSLAIGTRASERHLQIAAITPAARTLTPPETGAIRVACAISKGTTEIDWIGPQAVFQTWHRDPVSRRPAPKFQIVTVAESREPVDNRLPDYTFDTVPSPHVVVVPAQTGSPALLDWLRKIHSTADVTMSVCLGARHLAKAGLLTGRPATTHHESLEQFEKEFPNVKWVRGVRFVENDRIATAAGLTSGIDLALRVVERYFGRAAAQGVADHIEHDGTRWIVA